MNVCNLHAKLGRQTQACQEINKITYRKLHQTLSLNSILNFYKTLTEHWNTKSTEKLIKNLSILIKEVLTQMQRSTKSQSASLTGLQKLTSRTKRTLKLIYMKDIKDTPRPDTKPVWLQNISDSERNLEKIRHFKIK